ncbi:hypothetical protein Tco_1335124 [Tanacetum coccineum]
MGSFFGSPRLHFPPDVRDGAERAEWDDLPSIMNSVDLCRLPKIGGLVILSGRWRVQDFLPVSSRYKKVFLMMLAGGADLGRLRNQVWSLTAYRPPKRKTNDFE